jgi:hypothetical protein
MVKGNRAQGLPLNVIIIIVILLVTAVILIAIVSGKVGMFRKATDCPGDCKPEGSSCDAQGQTKSFVKCTPSGGSEANGICCVALGG